MKNSITPNQIKENNRNLIYQYLYRCPNVSQQDIAYNLQLSRPTVAANLSVLEEAGMVVKNGQITREYAGRRAAAYGIVPDYRAAIGVELLRSQVNVIAVDLYGREMRRAVYALPYRNEADYFQAVCGQILSFQAEAGLRTEQLLGVGFAIQGLISPDAGTVLYGQILDCTGLRVDAFARHLPCPCSFLHDADSAAIAELWAAPELRDACYLSLSTHLGASLIANRELIGGDHGHSSTIEHIQMEPEGRLCYCGRRGCLETLCSVHALLEETETLDGFFERVRGGETAERARWRTYLRHLARAVNLLHLIYDKTFILGGHLAPYLQAEDLELLYGEIRQLTPFPERSDFLQISKMPRHSVVIGAALPYIQRFLDAL